MIGSLRGVVLDRRPEGELLVEVGGVGYRVTVPLSTLAVAQLSGPAFLHVHTHVREDAFVLYGFATRDERDCFEALLAAHGVGPALALALLSVHSPAALRKIVLTEDADALTLVPGVGKKTAARLLLELQARLAMGDDDRELLLAGPTAAANGHQLSPRAEVRVALAGLGYGVDEVREAVRDLPEEGDATELLRVALRSLAGAR